MSGSNSPESLPRTDFLLLNASNFERNKIYPYAFVQVRALAKARGLSVATHDFLGVQPARYRAAVARLIARHRPRVVGITLRQADSIVHEEYACSGWKPYFPVENTAALIQAVREESDAPIVMGGFGFTTHARRIFEHLRPDFGIQGEADGLFARFEDVLQRRGLDSVDNLLYWDGREARCNPRVNHPPFHGQEYDEEVVGQLEAFYGRAHLYGDSPPTVPVEVARGCLFRCEFCTEPWVKGRSVRERDLDVVMADAEFLARRGIRNLFLVCSEINAGSSALALEVAERFLRLNEQLGSETVRWQAYHLPRWFSRDDLRTLFRSGFVATWNDFPSFVDENLVQLRVPYRARHVLEHVRNTLELQPPPPQGSNPHISLFLGNSHSTPATVARSVKAFNEMGLASRIRDAKIAFGTRLFMPEGATAPEGINPTTYTSAGIADGVDLVHPTYYLAPGLEAALPSADEQRAFFRYVASTLIGIEYTTAINWAHFLATAAPSDWVAGQLAAHRGRLRTSAAAGGVRGQVQEIVSGVVSRGTGEALEEFLLDTSLDDSVRRMAGALLVALVSRPVPRRYLEILDYLGLPHDHAGKVSASPYEVVVALLPRFDSVAALLADVESAFALEKPSKELWLLRRLFYEKNVILKPEYRPLLLVREEAEPVPLAAVPA